jgi:mRNA-degrading endonuclease RelE of RelBE toxin-antitoxin system
MQLNFRKVDRTPSFSKDLKKLLKDYPTLEGDLQTFIDVQLILYHKHNIDNGGIFRLSGLGFQNPLVFKAKKFACRSLKGKGSRSGIRVIYAYFPSDDQIQFVEIYYKEKDGTMEDRVRLKSLYG